MGKRNSRIREVRKVKGNRGEKCEGTAIYIREGIEGTEIY